MSLFNVSSIDAGSFQRSSCLAQMVVPRDVALNRGLSGQLVRKTNEACSHTGRGVLVGESQQKMPGRGIDPTTCSI